MENTKIIEGEVQNIRKDGKALQIENLWYHSFNRLPDYIKKGDNVKLTYRVNKGFNNIVGKIEYIDPINLKEIIETKLEKVKESPKELPTYPGEFIREIGDTSKNCILMQSVIIYLDRKDLTLNEIVKTVTESYKLIK